MDDKPKDDRFPSNSKYTNVPQNKRKPEEKKPAESVAKGTIIQKKKTLGNKFSETFLATDIRSVFHHVVFNVLVPSAIDTVYDIVRGATSMLLYGNKNGGGRSTRSDGSGGMRIFRDYDRMYDGQRRDSANSRQTEDRPSRQPSTKDVLENLGFDTREEADRVLEGLKQRIRDYEVASVKDLYDLADMETDWAKDKWGWFELNERNSGIIRVREGWLLKLPRPIVID